MTVRSGSNKLYVDMNSFFASCEQQEYPELRGKPVGVITHPSAFACVIAPSAEAKRFGIKTGMRLSDCKLLCPQIIPVLSRPYIYRQYHIKIMSVLKSYCEETTARSIDEAVMDLRSYSLVYPDLKALAKILKKDIATACGDFVKCSIGISANNFLAKLGTEIQKPDGLIEITPENIDKYLSEMKLTDLPGIARSNERRLNKIGIYNPLQLRHSSEALLRKAFGGVVGNYWYRRMNFREVDGQMNPYRAMSTARMVSGKQRTNPQSLESLFVLLCTRLEQRMVKQQAFCKELHFYIRYINKPTWETKIKLSDYTQDAVEIRNYILQRMREFEDTTHYCLLNDNVQHMGITVSSFLHGVRLQGNFFDNQINKDKARATMYEIKDRYRRDIVRRASEIISPYEMRDAIGFGSVKDFAVGEGIKPNAYFLEDDQPRELPKHVAALKERKQKKSGG
ncbi:MAG TPA: hypothetical protein VL098_04500 [Flavipsychrobacter sp.]|nr:hypothetical protein [Flavipsychrobacter sp.]